MLSVLQCTHTNTQNSNKKEQRNLGGDVDIFITLIVMMVSQYMYVQTHQVVYIKSVRVFACQLYCSVVVKKKKEQKIL